MKNSNIAGIPGILHAPIDWAAFGALQGRMKNCTDSFNARCLDEAADRVLSGRSYKHSGEKLAACLCRDCRGSTRIQTEQRLDFLGYDTAKVGASRDSIAARSDLQWAAQVLAQFIAALPAQARTLFAFEVQGAPRALILAATALAERQYRALRETCFVRIRANRDVMSALSVLREAGSAGMELFKTTLAASAVGEEVAA